VNKSLAFVGREKELKRLRALYAARKHVLIVGPPGIGKSALLQQMQQSCPMLWCEEASSLGRICECLERELGWGRHRLSVIERKNRLLRYVREHSEIVVLDHVALTPPRVARFIQHLADIATVWIICRSTHPPEIGHVWQHLFKFECVELSALTLPDVHDLVAGAVDLRNIQAEARNYVSQIYRLSRGVPRILEELLTEMAARRYKMNTASGTHLLELDRRIHALNQGVATILRPVQGKSRSKI
jgi:hypothetical protein